MCFFSLNVMVANRSFGDCVNIALPSRRGELSIPFPLVSFPHHSSHRGFLWSWLRSQDRSSPPTPPTHLCPVWIRLISVALYLHADLAAELCFLCCSPFRRTLYLGGGEKPQTPRLARWHCKIDCAKWRNKQRHIFLPAKTNWRIFFPPRSVYGSFHRQFGAFYACLYVCVIVPQLMRLYWGASWAEHGWIFHSDLWYASDTDTNQHHSPHGNCFFLPAPCSIYWSSVVFSSCVQFSFDPLNALSSKCRENYFLCILPCAQPRKAKMVICTISSSLGDFKIRINWALRPLSDVREPVELYSLI